MPGTSRPLIEQMGHRLTADVPDEPILVEADATRRAQVIVNLLTTPPSTASMTGASG